MINLFKYNLRIFLRNRDQIIWNTLFPFAFMLIYVMAMGNMASGVQEMPTIELALVSAEEGGNDLSLAQFFRYMDGEAREAEMTEEGLLLPSRETQTTGQSAPDDAAASPDHPGEENENKEDPFILYCQAPSYAVAEEWLKDDKVFAIVQERPGQSPKVEVLDQTDQMKPLVLKEVLTVYRQVNQHKDIVAGLVEEGRLSLWDAVFMGLEAGQAGDQETARDQALHQLDTSSRPEAMAVVNVFFFSMVAYLAFYPVSSGTTIVIATEADRSPEAVRQTVSPLSKRKRFIGNLLPYLLLVEVNTLLIFLVLQLLGVELGSHLGLVLLLMATTSLAAILTGSFLAACFAFSPNALIGLSIAVPLIFAFTSGMMSYGVLSFVKENIPWLMEINPIGLTTDALYYLNINEAGGVNLFWQQMMKLGIFCLVTFGLTLLGLRRKSYASL